jgi:hypothetical protein
VEQKIPDSPIRKPRGLWYECNKGWKEFVQREMPSWAEGYGHKYLLDVNLSRMCVIRTEKELNDFHDRYSFVIDNRRGEEGINWLAVSRDYDGIEICPYQWGSRNDEKTSWYYVWDVASGCIWGRGAFKGVTEIDNDIRDEEFKSPYL